MHKIVIALAISGVVAASSPAPKANFLNITVTPATSTSVRVIWRPFAGAETFELQQARIISRRPAPPDSLRRWQDAKSRDTVFVNATSSFVVDMTSGPVVFEVVKGDSVKIEAQLAPARGPIASAWGKVLTLESDGIAPWITRR